MANNTFGSLIRLTTFGESHGFAIGGVVDGCPAGVEIDIAKIQIKLDARKPGAGSGVSKRAEQDRLQIFSGIFEGKTTGMPIGFMIPNTDAKSADYDSIKEMYRPSHADFTYHRKYGYRDYRGGGRQSARETANWVVAGEIALQLMGNLNLKIQADVTQVGPLKYATTPNFKEEVDLFIEKVSQQGDSVGGVITCCIENVPIGLGEPIFNKLHAKLGFAMLSINGAKGFDYGLGFDEIHKLGSECNDEFILKNAKITTNTNHSGGIQGGISNGNDIYFRVAFKAPSSIMKPQSTVNVSEEFVRLEIQGRHDSCVLFRAIPIVEAMTALVLADFYLANKLSKID